MKKNQIPKSDPLPAKRTFTNILPAIQAKALLAIIRSSCHGTTICNVLTQHWKQVPFLPPPFSHMYTTFPKRGQEGNAGIFSNKQYTHSIIGWLLLGFPPLSIVITRDRTATKPENSSTVTRFWIERKKKYIGPKETRHLGLELTDTRPAWIKCPRKVGL